MPRRHPPLPRIWLMTDERMGEGLWQALARLPLGSGVVFRHYTLPPGARRALFTRIARIARQRRLILIRAGGARLGRGEAGTHNSASSGIRTASAHSRREAIEAIRSGAHLLFVSPVFATRSHPGAKALGPIRLGLLSRGLTVPVIALGGMNAQRARRLGKLRMYGWAAIDAWTRS